MIFNHFSYDRLLLITVDFSLWMVMSKSGWSDIASLTGSPGF